MLKEIVFFLSSLLKGKDKKLFFITKKLHYTYTRCDQKITVMFKFHELCSIFAFFVFTVILVHMSAIYCYRNGNHLISFNIKNNTQKP